MNLASINTEQRLYVLHCDSGYSCYGFDVLDRKARAVRAWRTGSKAPARFGTVGTEQHFEAAALELVRGAHHASTTGSRCPADLHSQLSGLEGLRVEVVDADDLRYRFNVGRSTGWMPCHLQLRNRASIDGPAVDSRPFKSVRPV